MRLLEFLKSDINISDIPEFSIIATMFVPMMVTLISFKDTIKWYLGLIGVNIQ